MMGKTGIPQRSYPTITVLSASNREKVRARKKSGGHGEEMRGSQRGGGWEGKREEKREKRGEIERGKMEEKGENAKVRGKHNTQTLTPTWTQT